MSKLEIGEKVKVRFVDNHSYVADVLVMEIRSFNDFIGCVEKVFADGAGEIQSGDILELIGKNKTFKQNDIILRD